MIAVLLALTGALAYGGADFYGGLAARKSSTLLATLGVALVGLACLSVVSPIVPATSSPEAWLFGGLSGLAGAIGIGLLYGSLAIGPMSILSPTTAFISAIVPVTIGISMGEGGGWGFYSAIFLALISVALVGLAPRENNKSARPSALGVSMAVGSGALIGLTIVLIDLTPRDSGLIPLLVNRIVSSSLLCAVFLCVTLVKIGSVKPSALRTVLPGKNVMTIIVMAGLLDAFANVAVIFGLRLGELSVVSVLVALYPAGTLLLAGIILGERVAKVQWVGLSLALIASALLSV